MPAIEAHVRGLVEPPDRRARRARRDGRDAARPGRRGPLVCVRSTDVARLVATLAEERIVVSLRDDNLRVALHLYNVEDDVDRLLAALAPRTARCSPDDACVDQHKCRSTAPDRSRAELW